jgi:cytochrome c oxidase subunit 1
MDNIWLWVIVAIALILVAYGPFFLTYSVNMVSPGFKLY